MRRIVTVGSKGQVTLPAAVRASLGLKKGDRLELSVDLGSHRLTITPLGSLEELSARVSGYAAKREPVPERRRVLPGSPDVVTVGGSLAAVLPRGSA